MALLCCDGVRFGQPCRTLFAVGLMACPHCKSTVHHEFGSQPGDEEHPQMPKIRRNYGPDAVTEPDAGAESSGAESGTTLADVHRPAVNDPKGAWAAWVNHLGGDVGNGDGHTKRQLIDLAEDIETAPVAVTEPDDDVSESEPADDDE